MRLLISEDWKGRYEKKAAKEEKLDELLREPLKYAEEKWESSHKIIYHDAMATILSEHAKYKNLHISEDTYKEKLRPIARRYRYSTFSKGEFKSQKDITILCQAIMADNNSLELKSPEYTIAWLNEMMENTGLNFSSLKDHVRESESFENSCNDINNNADSLFGEDIEKLSNVMFFMMMKNKSEESARLLKHWKILDFAPPKENLNELFKNYNKRYTRLFWEQTYPLITPKSLKHGLMRGWAGKKKGEQY